jgi:hypothetical protein
MKPIIKITDIESGKELKIVKGLCDSCFYDPNNCPYEEMQCCVLSSCLIFKEVTTKEEKK